jgi:hypothetical protein
MTTKPTILLLVAATGLAACQMQEPNPASNQGAVVGAPTLTGESAAVANVIPRLAAKRLTMQPVTGSRAEVISRFCTGGADALALNTPFTDVEAQRCVDMGGSWSAGNFASPATYLSRALAATNYEDFS